MAKKRPAVIRTIEEWDEYAPMLTKQTRPCAGCREPTLWRERGQSTLGRCLDCVRSAPVVAEVSEFLEERAEATLLAAFPGIERLPPTWGAREARTRRWMLCRGFWFVARRWEQKWVWCSPNEVAYLMKKGWQ